MTRQQARDELSVLIVNRQLAPLASPGVSRAYVRACGLPALVRMDDGGCLKTSEAQEGMLEAIIYNAAVAANTPDQ